MKKRGFTLVELLGIVALLAVIALIAVPAVVNMNKNSDKRNYERFLKDIYIAAENYVETHREEYPTLKEVGNFEYIQIEKLISEGYLKEGLMNPNTKEPLNRQDYVKVTVKNNGVFDYQLENPGTP